MVLVLVVPGLVPAAAPVTLPSPLTGPGHPQPPRAEERRLAKAWRDLEGGRTDRASRRMEKAGAGPSAQLLRLQIQLVEGGDPTVQLQQLVAVAPGYAAAWCTLSVAAEQAGRRQIAYDAATLAARLWPDSPWAARGARLRRQWVDAPVEQARRSLAEGAPQRALEELQPALALAPDDHGLILVQARAMMEIGRLQEAEDLVAPLLDDPAALMLAAEVAEKAGHLLVAMERYERVPDGTEGRDEGLERVRLRWRLSSLPRYAQTALTSPDLTRAQLATLLVNLAPSLETIPGGRVPLLSDIVDTPCQREILASVRLGLIDVDELEHRFDPQRPVGPAELRIAVDRLASLLGVDPPEFCDPAVVISSRCTEVASPVTGQTASDVILATVRRVGP